MKKILAILLALCMVVSMSTSAFATQEIKEPSTQYTTVTYDAGEGDEEGSSVVDWTVTIPAGLTPGEPAEVTASGFWAPSDILSVTADVTVTLNRSGGDAESDFITVPVSFNGIAAAGDFETAINITETIIVDPENTMSAIKLGIWEGSLTFYINLSGDNAPADDWDGTTGELPEVEENILTISTAEELAAFAAAVNAGDTYEGKTVKLDANINLANNTWTPISSFAGTFDGQEHTISNLKDAALFGKISGNAVVKNLKLSGAARTANSYNGAGAVFIGTVADNAVVENCKVSNVTLNWEATVTDCGDGVSGIIGGVNEGAAVKNCEFNNIKITAYGKLKRTGGIFSSVSGTVSDCTANGVSIITSGDNGYTQQAGGFVGTVNATANISDCTIDNVMITTEYAALKTGGFAGLTYGGTITNCDMNNVTMSVAKTYSEFAGFIGQHDSRSNDTRLTVTNSDVIGLNMTIKGYYQDWSCGSAGYISGVSGGADIINCSVAGVIDASEATVTVGGFVGSGGSSTGSIGNIENCVANVKIAVGDNAGGAFVGRAGRCMGADDDKIYFTFNNCEANGAVTATGTGTAGEFYGALYGTQNTFTGCTVNGEEFNG